MTIEEAVNHKWLSKDCKSSNIDLLPQVRRGFDAKNMFKKAVDVVKAVNKLSSSSLNRSRTNSNMSSIHSAENYEDDHPYREVGKNLSPESANGLRASFAATAALTPVLSHEIKFTKGLPSNS